VLYSGAEGPGFKSQSRCCLRQTVHNSVGTIVFSACEILYDNALYKFTLHYIHTHCASVHQAAKLVAALLRVARVTAGLAESIIIIKGIYIAQVRKGDKCAI